MPPVRYALLTCECAGEALVGSAVARKLEGLGALTKGDKTAGRGETGNNLGTNLETKVGLDALTKLKNSMQISRVSVDDDGHQTVIYSVGGVTLAGQEALLAGCNTVKQFLTRLQLLPFEKQLHVLRHFVSFIRQTDEAMASQLESTSVRIVGERVVFENRQNDAEKVTITEVECDHSCTWDAAKTLYTGAEGRQTGCAFMIEKDVASGRASTRIFLAVAVDAFRMRLYYPHRIHGGVISVAVLRSGALQYDMTVPQHRQAVEVLWQKAFGAAVSKGMHLESFALLNGSVFSIWYAHALLLASPMPPSLYADVPPPPARAHHPRGAATRQVQCAKSNGLQLRPRLGDSIQHGLRSPPWPSERRTEWARASSQPRLHVRAQCEDTTRHDERWQEARWHPPVHHPPFGPSQARAVEARVQQGALQSRRSLPPECHLQAQGLPRTWVQ